MSTAIMALCWPIQMPPSAKAVLVSLADNANDQGVCWPSISTIMARTCLCERAVQKQIKWLEESGILQRQKRSHQSTVYVIDVAKLKGAPDAPADYAPAQDAPTPPHIVRLTPAPDAPRTVSEPSIEPPKEDGSRKRSPRSDAGTRLDSEWQCPQEWLMEACKLQPTWGPRKALSVADAFRDYWVAIPGAKGRKTDWLATWRNWVRRERPEQSVQRISHADQTKLAAARAIFGTDIEGDSHGTSARVIDITPAVAGYLCG